MRIIEVAPLDCGWCVTADGLAGSMVFAQGGAAEAAARNLATRLARAGSGSELRIRLRDGSLAGRFICPAELEPHVAARTAMAA